MTKLDAPAPAALSVSALEKELGVKIAEKPLDVLVMQMWAYCYDMAFHFRCEHELPGSEHFKRAKTIGIVLETLAGLDLCRGLESALRWKQTPAGECDNKCHAALGEDVLREIALKIARENWSHGWWPTEEEIELGDVNDKAWIRGTLIPNNEKQLAEDAEKLLPIIRRAIAMSEAVRRSRSE